MAAATITDNSKRNSAKPQLPVSTQVPRPDSLRDTIESIVIAFIFAFVFRAFVVEAFIIPTGSMAPTLYGKHGQHRCACCQYAFAYGIRDPIDSGGGSTGGTLSGTFGVECPNCGWEGEGNDNLNNARLDTLVQGQSGDRILVLKWPYDVDGETLGPRRWDVVVFKDPQDAEQNFIKRLVGLPGEVLEIIDGDVYAAKVEKLSPSLVEALSADPQSSDRHLSPELRAELDSNLRIQRKTRVAQEPLWLIHYDHDYPANPAFTERRDRPFDPPQWEIVQTPPAGIPSPWNANSPRIVFAPLDAAEHELALVGKPIVDQCGYNLPIPQQSMPDVRVSDVRLSFVLIPKDSRGAISIHLNLDGGRFAARVHADGRVVLERTQATGIAEQLATRRISPLRRGEPLTIAIENVDYRIALIVNDEEVVATSDEQYHPNIPDLRRRRDGERNQVALSIGAAGLPLELLHVAVHRDIFYRSTGVQIDDYSPQHPWSPQVSPYARRPGWGTTNNPILLSKSPGDYFCCGDNSQQSKDSRLWWEVAPMLIKRGKEHPEFAYHPGTVPADQMIGRAFFVYWPSGHRITFGSPGFIPNVGRMGFIR